MSGLRGRCQTLSKKRPLPFPSNAEELRAGPLLNSWWYYQVELLPGVVAQGAFPQSHPMLPRLLMRRCDLRGMACLDIGTMEGLTPVLMSRGGASRVLAIDGADHCLEKLAAVKHYYGASFEYRTVGHMYSLSDKLEGEGFDLINCSGLLYHVFSPLMVLAGLRGAVKRRGLMIVATALIVDRGFSAEFNAAGRFQKEPNTFWYLSTGLLDYLLRYLRLAPIDVIYQPHDVMTVPWRLTTGKPSGHAAILCQAVDQELPGSDDEWMSDSARSSWEYEWNLDWSRADAQPVSRIKPKPAGSRWRELIRRRPRVIDLTTAIEERPPVTEAAVPSNSYTLSLADRT
jgi:SAM-dependent methyltransferase